MNKVAFTRWKREKKKLDIQAGYTLNAFRAAFPVGADVEWDHGLHVRRARVINHLLRHNHFCRLIVQGRRGGYEISSFGVRVVEMPS